MSKSYYVTTPIYYVNAEPHIGHAYTCIVADVMSRFHQMAGCETFFLTGTDEHGDKIARAAATRNISPKEFVDQISQKFSDMMPRINARYDRFIRTTDPDHRRVVTQILQRVYDNGDIYFGSYEGLYCFGCERFLGEGELVNGLCPDHQKAPEKIKETNYFFRMKKYGDWLVEHIEKHPDFIRPERYKNEVLGYIRTALEDLCISRPKSRLTWGIELPFDANYVTYVWFDALLNYLTGIGYPDGPNFNRLWPVAEHFIGKDIVKQHGVYWPTMLKAAGIEPFAHLNVHGYWNTDTGKMSKSLGNVITPLDMIDKYGLDALRYYLLREMSFGLDAVFSEESFVFRYNGDLANDLGNMVSRLTRMIQSYCDGLVPAADELTLPEVKLNEIAEQARHDLQKHFKQLMMHQGIEAVNAVVRATNKYLDETAPWAVAKKKDQARLNTILFTAANNTVRAALWLLPIMPDKCREIFRWFGVPERETWLLADEPLQPGYRVAIAETPVFPRQQLMSAEAVGDEPKSSAKSVPSEAKPVEKKSTDTTGKTDAPAGSAAMITYDDFAKIDLRVATILQAEKVEGADKLLRLQIEVGEEKRQIVAGIAQHYAPESLVGKQIVVVANLKPAKIRGIESNGMLLAVNDGQKLVVVSPEAVVASGTKVK